MYGLAGYKHTSGMPDMNGKIDKLTHDMAIRNPAIKGKAGQRPLRNLESKQRYKDDKQKYDKANQENARRLGVR